MSNEELLKPRYKVIGRYPDSPFQVGDIWQEEKIWQVSEPEELENYPLIFRKLEWWEDRKPEDMPRFVKNFNRVYKHDYRISVKGKFQFNQYLNDKPIGWITITDGDFGDYLPATEAEYIHSNNKP